MMEINMRKRSDIRIRKGISELVVILLILAIAIPAVILLQSWLNSQISTLPVIEKVRASYDTSYVGYTLVTLRISNDGSSPANITKITLVYRNNYNSEPQVDVISGINGSSFIILGQNTLPIRIDPGQSITIILRSSSSTSYVIDKVIISIISSTRSGSETSVEALGA
ncbi:MAG: hypothetical protein QW366_00285 [Sulfolobales archaeon]